MSMTSNGRQLYKFIARFIRKDAFDRSIDEKREIMAVSQFQAKKKAEGIAKKDGWIFISVGRA